MKWEQTLAKITKHLDKMEAGERPFAELTLVSAFKKALEEVGHGLDDIDKNDRLSEVLDILLSYKR